MDGKIQRLIKRFVKNYKTQNKTETDWNDPLVAFADANDLLFERLKTDIIPSHNTPTELLNDAKTVISYFIPFKEEIAQSNVGGRYCSKEWAIAYIETNKLISDLNKYLAKELEKLNFKSVIKPPTYDFDKKTLISNWSHKHVAFISGLGKFGSHKMLITEKGCCGRLGTLITSAKIQPTKRSNKEFCLFKHNTTCKKCFEKCTFGALTVESYERHKCYETCLSNANIYSGLGLPSACGKCACGVPCSFSNPVK
ncbi:MAG: epoxyqueuosine reductase [Candidatus Hodarchaeota archaeon]